LEAVGGGKNERAIAFSLREGMEKEYFKMPKEKREEGIFAPTGRLGGRDPHYFLLPLRWGERVWLRLSLTKLH